MTSNCLANLGLRKPNYDKTPYITVPGHQAWSGWDDVARSLASAAATHGGDRTIIAIECYTEVIQHEI
jgi:hypothetical protein